MNAAQFHYVPFWLAAGGNSEPIRKHCGRFTFDQSSLLAKETKWGRPSHGPGE
jgi:hypothetical protein